MAKSLGGSRVEVFSWIMGLTAFRRTVVFVQDSRSLAGVLSMDLTCNFFSDEIFLD